MSLCDNCDKERVGNNQWNWCKFCYESANDPANYHHIMSHQKHTPDDKYTSYLYNHQCELCRAYWEDWCEGYMSSHLCKICGSALCGRCIEPCQVCKLQLKALNDFIFHETMCRNDILMDEYISFPETTPRSSPIGD